MIVTPPSFVKDYRQWLVAFALAAAGHWSLVWALGNKPPEATAMTAVMLNFAEVPQSSMQIEAVSIGKPQQATPDSMATPPEPQPEQPTEPPNVVVDEAPVEQAEIVVKKQPKRPEKPKEKPESPKKIVKKPVPSPKESAKLTENRKPEPNATVSEVNSQASAAATATAPKGNDQQIAAARDSFSASKSETQNWQSQVLGHLSRHLQYPVFAQQNNLEGTPWVLIEVDSRGAVRSATLRKSSGVNVLDNEALALAKRASPLPAPPPNMLKGDSIRFAVPIRFNLREFKQRKG